MSVHKIIHSRYAFYQPNPTEGKKSKKGDCVVRAITKVLNLSWLDAYDYMCKVGREIYAMPNDKVTEDEALKRLGFVKHTIKVTKGSTRPTVDSFAKDHPKGTYLLKVAHHAVACVDGKYYDSWDSGEYSLYGYLEKK